MVAPVTKQSGPQATHTCALDSLLPAPHPSPATTRAAGDGFETKSDHNRLLGHVEREIVGQIDTPTVAEMVDAHRQAQTCLVEVATPVDISAAWSMGDILMAPLRATLPIRWRRAPGGVPTLRPCSTEGAWAYVEPHRWPEFALNHDTNRRVSEYVDQGRSAPYDLIGVPGFSTEDQSGALSARAKDRLLQAADDWRQGTAPFILVTGGDVYPAGTSHIEAIEMRRYLIDELGVPSDRIIVEPNARHTTTNLRNAGRYMKKMGLERALVVSSPTPLTGQSSYIQAAGRLIGGFHLRCRSDLGAVIGSFDRVDGWRTAFVPYDTVNLIARDPDLRDP